jgi:hypothetical protein
VNDRKGRRRELTYYCYARLSRRRAPVPDSGASLWDIGLKQVEGKVDCNGLPARRHLPTR